MTAKSRLSGKRAILMVAKVLLISRARTLLQPLGCWNVGTSHQKGKGWGRVGCRLAAPLLAPALECGGSAGAESRLTWSAPSVGWPGAGCRQQLLGLSKPKMCTDAGPTPRLQGPGS